MELDQTDRAILRHLQEDGRMSHAALAEAVGLTPTPLRQRVDKLERAGVILGYRATVDPAGVDRATVAFVHVTLAGQSYDHHFAFIDRVQDMPEVLEAHHIAGEEDFLLKVAVRDVRAYEWFLLERLSKLELVDRVKTTFVLSSAKSDAPLAVDEGSAEPQQGADGT